MSTLRVLLFAMLAATAAAKCVPFEAASQNIGETACVTGNVLKVAQTRNGNYFLNFCQDYHSCAFTVFVPAKNLCDVGDVRQLEGKTIEVYGKIRSYQGRAEIVLKQARQLRGEAAKIPPLPKTFDASRKGKFSAGTYSSPKSQRQTTTSGRTSTTLGSGLE